MTPWNEWHERCAVALCSEATQAALYSFGGQRFRTLAQRGMAAINVSDVALVAVPDADAWHLLETHMTLPSAINGKAYKQWLFARMEGATDAPFDVVQGGATLLMRWVVREHLRNEHLPAGHVSLNQPLPADRPAESRTEEWLPGLLDTRDTVERRELESLARQHATDLFGSLSTRHRMALAARFLGIPLSTPRLLELLGCGRSVLHAAYRELATNVLDHMRTQYPSDDRDTVRDLAIHTFDVLMRQCADWAEAHAAYRQMLPAHSNRGGQTEVIA